MRILSRQYKVPRRVQGERVEICWLNSVRVRALRVEAHGYDPEVENWDQTPYRKNGTGSQNARTPAVAESFELPIVENHSATRERWTGNVRTFSDKPALWKGSRHTWS